MNNKTILTKIGQDLVFDLKKSVKEKGLSATGDLEKSIQYELKSEGEKDILIVSAKRYFGALEFGRKKSTKSDGGLLFKAIVRWLQAKGLKLNPYAVTRKIHKYGIKVPNKYNKGKVITDVINQKRIDEIRKEIAKNVASNVNSAISNILKNKQF